MCCEFNSVLGQKYCDTSIPMLDTPWCWPECYMSGSGRR